MSQNSDDNNVEVVKDKEERRLEQEEKIQQFLSDKKEIIQDINKIEEQLRILDDEEEADIQRDKKEGGIDKMEDFNIREIITDGWWRFIVAIFGIILIYYLVINTVAGVEIVLKGSAPEDEEEAEEDATEDAQIKGEIDETNSVAISTDRRIL